MKSFPLLSRFFLFLPLTLIPLFLLASCSQGGIFELSSRDEIRLNHQVEEEIRKTHRIFPELSERLAQIGERLIRAGPWPKEFANTYSFVVAEDPKRPETINAFAAPAGFVVVYKRLYDDLRERGGEGAIAAVLAHEIEHAARHHVSRSIEKQSNLGLIATLLGIITRNRAAAQAASILASLQSLRYSRAYEQEADEYGIYRLWRAGYAPYAMAEVFRYFLSKKEGGKTPAWLSTHPADEKRLRLAEERAKMLGQRSPHQVITEAKVYHEKGQPWIPVGWVDGVQKDMTVFLPDQPGKSVKIDKVEFGRSRLKGKSKNLPEGTVVQFNPPLKGAYP